MDSTKFESILGKYLVEGGVKVDKIVVITHHGFYQPVVDRAKQLKIDLFTLEQAEALDWASLLPKSLHFSMPPHLCGFQVWPEIDQELEIKPCVAGPLRVFMGIITARCWTTSDDRSFPDYFRAGRPY